MPQHHAVEALEEERVILSSERIPGSARGARVGGSLVSAFFGSTLYLPTVAADWSLSETQSTLILLPFLAFWAVRLWFMGIWILDKNLVLRGWFRRTEIPLSQIEGVTLVRYAGLLSYGSIGWIPIAGPIAVIKIREASRRAREFSGTVGRKKTVSNVARLIRQKCGIAATRYDFESLE